VPELRPSAQDGGRRHQRRNRTWVPVAGDLDRGELRAALVEREVVAKVIAADSRGAA
jgi:hypothetical protein